MDKLYTREEVITLMAMMLPSSKYHELGALVAYEQKINKVKDWLDKYENREREVRVNN